MSLHVVGVRHHSPVCAGLVQRTLAKVKPRWVLIEGPSDFNARIGELALDHEPPVALFSFHFDDRKRHSTWSPFCVHSPEWVALRDGLAAGAEVRFIDLPSWSQEFDGIDNRYADGPQLQGADTALQRNLGERGYDAFWDAAFELPPPEGLKERLHVYFDGLRHTHPASASDLGREAFMAAYVRWALDQGGDVLVVCGGFHAPVLREAHALPPVEAEPLPPEPADDSRSETWLIPFDQRRLDSFRGYASGLPSPAWYRWVWELGLQGAPRRALQATVQGLRARGQPISVADSVAAWTHAQALARMRAHPVVARVDLLDAIASTWVKDALEVQLPWTTRAVLPAGTHPVVVELVRALSGELRGTLHPDTPLPRLVHHVRKVQRDLDLGWTDAARAVELSLGDPAHRDRIVALERLLLLGIDGVHRHTEPGAVRSRYTLQRTEHSESSLLEAASYGPTLQMAALAVLEEVAAGTEGVDTLVGLLVAAVNARLPGLSDRALEGLTAAITAESQLGALGHGLSRMVGLLRHGALETGQRADLSPLIEIAADRVLWLVEGLHGDGPVDMSRVRAVAAVRDAALQSLAGPTSRITGVLQRVSADALAPCDLRGACLGGLASLGIEPLDTLAERALHSLGSVPGVRMGDYLAGLLGVAREVVDQGDGLLAGVDASLQALDPEAFKRALPSLRVAFHSLPPRERASMGRAISKLHGALTAPLHGLLQIDPEQVAQAQVLEADASEWLTELGLHDGR